MTRPHRRSVAAVPSWQRLPLLSLDLDFTQIPNRTFNLIVNRFVSWFISVQVFAETLVNNPLLTRDCTPDNRGVAGILISTDVLNNVDATWAGWRVSNPELFQKCTVPQERYLDYFFSPLLCSHALETPEFYSANSLYLVDVLHNAITQAYIFKYGRLSPILEYLSIRWMTMIRRDLGRFLTTTGGFLSYLPSIPFDHVLDESEAIEWLIRKIHWSPTKLSEVTFVPNSGFSDHPSHWVFGNLRRYGRGIGLTGSMNELLMSFHGVLENDRMARVSSIPLSTYFSQSDPVTLAAATKFKYAAVKTESMAWSMPESRVGSGVELIPEWVRYISVNVFGGKPQYEVVQAKNGMPRRVVARVIPERWPSPLHIRDLLRMFNEAIIHGDPTSLARSFFEQHFNSGLCLFGAKERGVPVSFFKHERAAADRAWSNRHEPRPATPENREDVEIAF